MLDKIRVQQQNEQTEEIIYRKLAAISDDGHNRDILLKIASDERRHYTLWHEMTGEETKPDLKMVNRYLRLAKWFGLSFALRKMEQGERDASRFYDSISEKYPQALDIKKDEDEHEHLLIDILNDERLNYAGAIVLGLNDALVEFTGTLAGLTFAFSNNLIVGTTGLVMGVAASLSMAASGYLASREEQSETVNPVTSAIYTGVSYIGTVALLVLPYLLQPNPYIALGAMLLVTIVIIAGYTYFISVAKQLSFTKRFLEMAAISIGVAVISFGIGVLVKHVFGIDV